MSLRKDWDYPPPKSFLSTEAFAEAEAREDDVQERWVGIIKNFNKEREKL